MYIIIKLREAQPDGPVLTPENCPPIPSVKGSMVEKRRVCYDDLNKWVGLCILIYGHMYQSSEGDDNENYSQCKTD